MIKRKQRKDIIELAQSLPPTTIARLTNMRLDDIEEILKSDNNGARRDGAMATKPFVSGMPIQRDTTSTRDLVDRPISMTPNIYDEIGTPYEMPTTPSGGATMYPMGTEQERMMTPNIMQSPERERNPMEEMYMNERRFRR